MSMFTAPAAAPVAPAAAPEATTAPVAPAATAESQVSPKPAEGQPEVKPEGQEGAAAVKVAVPAGTQEKMLAFHKGEDKSPEALAKVLEGLTPEAAEKVKATLEGKADEEIDFEELEASPDDIPDDILENLPPQVSDFMKSLVEENESLKQNSISPEMEQVLMDPVIKARVEALTTGAEIAVPSFADALGEAGIDTQKLFDGIQEMFETEGQEPDARKLMAEAFEVAVKAAVAKAQAATIAKLDAEHKDATARTQMASFYDSGIEAVAKGLGGSVPLLIENGGQKEYNPEHPVAPFIRYLYEGQQDGTIPYATVQKLGVDALFQAWRVQQAGGVGNYMGEIKKSAADKLRDLIKGKTTTALRDVAAKTPGSEGTAATATVVVNGVNIAQAVADKSGRYVDDVVRSNNLTPKQHDEIVSAMRKYALSQVR